MNEKPRYLTDEEMLFDGECEGFGVSLHVVHYDMSEMEAALSEVYLEESTRLDQVFAERTSRGRALLRNAREGVQDFFGLFEEEIEWANDAFPGIDKKRKQSSEPIPTVENVELDLLRLETDGYMIYQAPSNNSPKE